MALKRIRLYNFRNYTSRIFDFKNQIICLYGPNGSGKTNVLEAIYYLCFTRAYRSSLDKQNIKHETNSMAVEGWFENETVKCIIKPEGKKEVFSNNTAYSKFSEHIGKFPAVMVSPDDTYIISGYSSDRRKYFDLIISQTNREYLGALIKYKKTLQQRNAFLKASKRAIKNNELLEIYDQSLVSNGKIIFEARDLFIKEYVPILIEHYNAIAGKEERAKVEYLSQLTEGSLAHMLRENLEKDLVLQRTSIGVHKDEFDFSCDGMSVKQTASQGQRKTFLFALKLAEYEYLNHRLERKPLLLLDDVFEKLDAERSQKLIENILQKDTQVFITDTHLTRLENGFNRAKEKLELISL